MTKQNSIQSFVHGDGQPLTMSSREIADLCEKNHAHVMRDIRTMLDGLEIGQSTFGSTYTDAQGEEGELFVANLLGNAV